MNSLTSASFQHTAVPPVDAHFFPELWQSETLSKAARDAELTAARRRAIRQDVVLHRGVGEDLSYLDLRQMDLENQNLADADLRKSDLRRARLWGANLRRARLQGADLREADLTLAVLKDASYDEATLWPVGFEPQRRGAVKSA